MYRKRLPKAIEFCGQQMDTMLWLKEQCRKLCTGFCLKYEERSRVPITYKDGREATFDEDPIKTHQELAKTIVVFQQFISNR